MLLESFDALVLVKEFQQKSGIAFLVWVDSIKYLHKVSDLNSYLVDIWNIFKPWLIAKRISICLIIWCLYVLYFNSCFQILMEMWYTPVSSFSIYWEVFNGESNIDFKYLSWHFWIRLQYLNPYFFRPVEYGSIYGFMKKINLF